MIPVGKLRLATLDRLDGRTLGARRARELARSLEAEIGGKLSTAQRLAVERAAVLLVVAEDAAARRLAGDGVSLDDVVRTERVASLAVKRLGIEHRRSDSSFAAALPDELP